MALPDDLANLVEIESAEIEVSSNVNFSFDWGTIGIIVGAVVALLVVIFAIAFFCGRGCGFCCDNVCCKGDGMLRGVFFHALFSATIMCFNNKFYIP